MKSLMDELNEKFIDEFNEKYNERYYLVTRDFQAYNPHYDLKKPIEVKRNDVIMCNGGVVETMLKESGYVEYLTDLRHFDGMVGFCLNTLIKVHDFRTIEDGSTIHEICNLLLKFEVRIPVFYWFDNYDLNKFKCKVKTHDIFGKDTIMSDGIADDNNYAVASIFDVGVVGFVEKPTSNEKIEPNDKKLKMIEIDGVQYIPVDALITRICKEHETIDDIVEDIAKSVREYV